MYAGHVWIPSGFVSRERERGPKRAAGEELASL